MITAEQIHLVKGKLAKSDTLKFYNLYIIPNIEKLLLPNMLLIIILMRRNKSDATQRTLIVQEGQMLGSGDNMTDQQLCGSDVTLFGPHWCLHV